MEYSSPLENFFDFEPGRVVWVKTREPKSIDLGAGRSVSQKGPAMISLQPNQFTDFALPFKYDIKIGDVIQASGLPANSVDFYSWVIDSTGRYCARNLSIFDIGLDSSDQPLRSQTVGTLLPVYTVLNSSGTPATLLIPPIPASISTYQKASLVKRASGDRWSVQVAVRADNMPLNDIYCAWAPGPAGTGYHALPPSFSSVRAGVCNRKDMKVCGHAVVHGSLAGAVRFDIAFVNGEDRARTFAYSARPVGGLPQGMQSAFYEPSANAWISADRDLTVTVGARSTAYRVLAVGTPGSFGTMNAAGQDALSLLRCTAKPSAGMVQIHFQMPATGVGSVTFALHDLNGRLVWQQSINRNKLHSGSQTVVWDGKASSGSQAPAGVYLLTMRGFSERHANVGFYKTVVTYLP